MRIFGKKSFKNLLSIGGSDPNPVCFRWLGAEPLNPRVVTPTCYYNFVQFSYRQHRVFNDQNYNQHVKDTMFRNRPQRLSFLVSIAGTTGKNMSVENNICISFAKQIKKTNLFIIVRLCTYILAIIFFKYY